MKGHFATADLSQIVAAPAYRPEESSAELDLEQSKAKPALAYTVELWNETRGAVEQVLAMTPSAGIGFAAYYAATREYPSRYITLKHCDAIVSRWNGRINRAAELPEPGPPVRVPPATMKQAQLLRRADEAALEAYSRARGLGQGPERALSAAIILWLRHCECADGRQARARVREVLLRTRAMAPHDYDDWIIIASGDDVWGAGAPVAIHRLSLDCRTLDLREAGENSVADAADAEPPAPVLLPADAARDA